MIIRLKRSAFYNFYAILKNYYKNEKIYIGKTLDSIKEQYLELYKTGRTNANDGGIDFVMRPL